MVEHEIESHPYSDHDEHMLIRSKQNDIATASVAGALWDRHPWVSKLHLYVRARGVELPERNTAAMERGRRLEPVVAAWFAERRPDLHVAPTNQYFRIDSLRLGGSPDLTVIERSTGRIGTAQMKTTTPNTFESEWDEGRRLPDYVGDQVHLEAYFLKAEFALVPVLVIDQYTFELHILDVDLDAAHQHEILERARQLRDDVVMGREPVPDFAKDAGLIRALTPRELPNTVLDLSGDNEVPVLLDRRANLRDQIKLEEAECEVIETELRYRMNTAERIIGIPGWSISYKTTEYKEYTVQARSTRVLRINPRRAARAA